MNSPVTPIPLARQISRIYTTAMVVSLMLIISLVVVNELFEYRERFVSSASIETEIISKNIETSLAFDDALSASSFLFSLAPNPEIDVAAVFDANGKLFAVYRRHGVTFDPANHQLDEKNSGPNFLRHEMHRNVYASDSINKNAYLGHLVIKYNRRGLMYEFLRAILTFVVVFGTALVVGRFIIARRQRMVTEPITQLTIMARRISELPEYGITVATDGRVKEIAELAESFNDMLTQIKMRDDELARNNEQLEQMIAARTKELLEANSRLQEQFQQLERMQTEMIKAQKLESLGVLAGGVAHNFNNVLTGILGYISYACKQLDEHHKAYLPLKHAEQATKRAGGMANQLMTFARGSAPDKKPAQIKRMVEDSIGLSLPGKRFSADIELPASLHTVKVDEGQIIQVFNNLLINAVQAMPKGGKVSICGENVTMGESNSYGLPPGGYVRIDFIDQGGGIPQRYLNRIFDPYFTTKAEGTGLGLSTVNTIIHKHGGHVSVQSLEGRGSTFTVLLPSTEIVDHAIMPAATVAVPRQTGTALLVMDADDSISDVVKESLGFMGITVTVCRTAKDAIAQVASAQMHGSFFDAVVLDLTTPHGEEGKQAARTIRSIAPDIPLIATNAYAADQGMADYRDYGFVGTVRKPFNAEEMSRALLDVQNGARETTSMTPDQGEDGSR